jgi:outer membrane protein
MTKKQFPLLALLTFCTFAFAEEKQAYIDVIFAIENVKQGKAAKLTLEALENQRMVFIQETEKQLMKEQDDFGKQSAVLNEAARIKKQTEIQKKIISYQEKASKMTSDQQDKQKELLMPIMSRINDIAEKLRVKKQLSRIFRKETLIAADPAEDLTQEVIHQYDTTYSLEEKKK